MASSTEVDRETLLARLEASRLIPDHQLIPAISALPANCSGQDLARSLIKKGLLTRFQAERLLAGLTQGFILGQYRVLDELGKGGMGRVFKAEHLTMHRIVALKVLSAKVTKTDRSRKLFFHEARAAAKLHHPNIVTAFDANETGGRCYLVMEFVDGPNLSNLLKERGPLPIGQACEIIRQSAEALEYAHALGMVHRDIKPANLLLQPLKGPARPNFRVKVLDFGLARLGEADPSLSHAVAAGADDSIHANPYSITGTPDYLSPEQARDVHNVDARSDIYSLGCTFYALLSAQVPFPGGTYLEKLVRHSTEPPVPLRNLRPEVPANVLTVIRKMMAKNPADRYQTATELRQALQTLCESKLDADEELEVENLPSEYELPAFEVEDESPWSDLGSESEPGTSPLDGGPTLIHSRGPRSGRMRATQPSTLSTKLFWLFLGAVLGVGGTLLVLQFLN